MPRLRPDGTHYPSMMPKLCTGCGQKGSARSPVTAVADVYAHAACRVVWTACSVGRCNEQAKANGLCTGHYNKKYYDDRADEMRERAKRWHHENPEKVAARYKQDRDAGRHRAYARTWYWNHRMQSLTMAHNLRSRRLGATGQVTEPQMQARWDMFAGRCYLCGNEADGFDHVKPISAGGLHIAANVRPACTPCNSKKGKEWEGSSHSYN